MTKIVIKTKPGTEGDVGNFIHNQLIGNIHYINCGIVFNDSGTRCDGTENELHLYIAKDVEVPKLKYPDEVLKTIITRE